MFSARGGFEYAYSSGPAPASYVTTITASKAYSTATTSDGTVTYVTGTSATDTPLIKLNAAGNITAQTTLVGSSQARNVVVDSSNNVYLAGLYSGDGNDAYVVKYNSSLAIQWQRAYSSGAGNSDFWTNSTVDSGGNVVLGGSAGADGAFVMYNSSGTLQWQRLVSNSSLVEGVSFDNAGFFYTFSAEKITTSLDGFVLTKWNTTPTAQWTRRIAPPLTDPTSSTSTRGIAIDSSNNIFVYLLSSSSLHIFKYNSSGTLQWKNVLSQTMSNLPGLATDNSGNLYISGYITSPARYWVAKINSSGAFVWQTQMTSTNTLVSTEGEMYWSNGYVYISGGISSPATNLLLAKIPDTGQADGTYGAYTWTTTAYTWSTSTATSSTTVDSTSTPSYTSSTSTFTQSTPTYTQTITTL